MQVRRIVTGRDTGGQSIFVSDAAAPRAVAFQHVPGLAAALVWGTPTDPTLGTTGDPSLGAAWVPPVGAVNLMVVTFPPDAVMMRPDFDPMAAGGEYMQLLPGLAESFERDSPGMHTTDTIDYAVVLDGEIVLELDGGAVKTLARHDVVVQNGTRHAWRNPGDKPATVLFVLVGARRG